MRLTTKITLAVLLGVTLIFSAYSYFSIQRERAQLKKNLSRESRHIGESLRVIMVELWKQRGEKDAILFLKKANQGYKQTLVRWVWVEENPPPEYQPRVPIEQLKALRDEETVALLAGSPDGRDFLLTYLPLLTDDGRIGAIELTESMDELHDYVEESLRRSALVIGASIVSGVLFMGVLGSIWVERPMRKLKAQAERIGTGDFTTSINLPGSGEITELSETIEKMRGQLAEAREAERIANEQRIEALERLRHSERLATLGQLSAGIAHELGTPLNVISGRAKLISRPGMEADDISRSARIIGEQSERMTQIIRQLLSFARREKPRKQPIDLNTVLRGLQPLLDPTAHKQGVSLVIKEAEQPLPAYADPGQSQQVLLNLTLNAIQAMPEGGEIEISCTVADDVKPPDSVKEQAQRWVKLEVSDQGVGIDEEKLRKIFDPFYTTKDVGEGTGLGLSIAYGIVEEHGGWIDVKSTPGEGSCFSVYLPEATDGHVV